MTFKYATSKSYHRISWQYRFVSLLLIPAFVFSGAPMGSLQVWAQDRDTEARLNANSNPQQGVGRPQSPKRWSRGWRPPSADPYRPTNAAKRGEAKKSRGVASRGLDVAATNDRAIERSAAFREPLRPLPGRADSAENSALAAATNLYTAETSNGDTTGLESFTQNFPGSRWAPAVSLNLGTIHFKQGRFSTSMEHWWQAWLGAKDSDDEASAEIANLALAEYALMHARVGRMERLRELLDIAKDRKLRGQARLLFERASDGYGTMLSKPEVAFKCGPFALATIQPLLSPESVDYSWLDEVHSPDTGFSMAQVSQMANRLELGLKMAKRQPGAEVLYPSVVHWKVGHFGAIVRELNGRYLIEDPTFGTEVWISSDALDDEASGFFLVPDSKLPAGWSAVGNGVAAKVFGKGHSGRGGEDDTACDDKKAKEDCGDNGMAVYNFHLLLASLNISDTPVWFNGPVGPGLPFGVTYNQRENAQPSTFSFSNFGAGWVSDWISYIEDDTTNPGGTAYTVKQGGGREDALQF